MSDHVELTEDERDWLTDVWDEETTVSAGAFYPVVARIIQERLEEQYVALADRWNVTLVSEAVWDHIMSDDDDDVPEGLRNLVLQRRAIEVDRG